MADGSYTYPFGSIMKALKAAEDISALYSYSTINIYLMRGDHFMTRNLSEHEYTFNSRDQYSLSKDITIRPVFCNETIDGFFFDSAQDDCVDDGESVTVYYQLGNDFRFDIPKSLTISNIIFDALDSSLDSSLN